MFPDLAGTSNATTLTITGLPVALRPQVSPSIVPAMIADAGGYVWGIVQIASDGTIAVYRPGYAGWAASGSKTVQGFPATYTLP
jgi:hypothetical protein